MASLLERLQEALSPDYEVQHELAAGGMGVVFLARDVALDRRVAVKVLLPEIATEVAAQRFLREARILASLSHSHIIPVHHVGEADGLFYYVMDYMEGATLADALRRGPMSVGGAVKLGRDLLDALEEVHKRGIVHRDIKPANVFLLGRRALLGDFGIAKPRRGTEETLTQTGGVIGTPDYMPPEQISGHEVSAQTDVYTVAMVLYEAISGRRWNIGEEPSSADWSGVPGKIARVLRGALAFDPENRWPDAATFRKKLWNTRVRRYQWRAAALTAAGIVAGGVFVGTILTLRNPSPVPGALVVRVEPFQQVGADALRLTDSVTAFVVRSLGQSTDFHVCEPSASCRNATVTLHGSVTLSDVFFTVKVETRDLFGLVTTEYASRMGRSEDWRVVADSVAYDVLRALWSQSSPLAKWLPRRALPQGNTSGFNRFIAAERLFNEARWGEARDAYAAAAEGDSGCWLCSWRITEIDRQRPGAGLDSVHMQRVLDNRELFPAHYQPLIELETLEAPDERLDILRTAVARWPHFYYLHYRLGEELFNRGPLAGHLRREARLPLLEATRRRPGFGPAWQELAWVEVAEGDAERARDALDNLFSLPEPKDPFSRASRMLISVGAAYRFEGTQGGGDALVVGLDDPEIGEIPDLPSGPRLMPLFDAPEGAVHFGKMVAAMGPGSELEQSGLIAQMFGHLALGQISLARRRARDITTRFELDGFRLFAAQLDAFLLFFDAAAVDLDRNTVVDNLRQYVGRGSGTEMQRRRAAWTLALLQRQAGQHVAADRNAGLVVTDSEPQPLAILLEAQRHATDGDLERALLLAEGLTRWERAKYVTARVVGPFFRTALHLLRAEWYAASNNPEAARRQLVWHEGWDQTGLPIGAPRVEEVDWAFGTIGRWRRASVLERLGDEGELCHVYGDIERLWSKGDPVYAARADTAQQRFRELDCEATSG
ncbi:MAG: serine/threonine protein kinase [Gemmatimonadetes bacterium]|nr:serine/threonine protein kinase [Gemmatimonadota bacterium]